MQKYAEHLTERCSAKLKVQVPVFLAGPIEYIYLGAWKNFPHNEPQFPVPLVHSRTTACGPELLLRQVSRAPEGSPNKRLVSNRPISYDNLAWNNSQISAQHHNKCCVTLYFECKCVLSDEVYRLIFVNHERTLFLHPLCHRHEDNNVAYTTYLQTHSSLF